MSDTDTTTQDGVQPTPAGSESDQSTPGGDGTGAGGDGAGTGGGSQSSADTFAEERAKLQETARGLQAERDRLKAELAAARKPEVDEGNQPQPLTAEGVLTLLERRDAIASVKAAAPEKYPNADPSILARANEYESAEALTAALEASNTLLGQHIEARAKTASEELLARYVERFGEIEPAPQGDGTGGSAGGDPTIDELAAMSQSEFEAVAPEVRDRVMRSATQ